MLSRIISVKVLLHNSRPTLASPMSKSTTSSSIIIARRSFASVVEAAPAKNEEKKTESSPPAADLGGKYPINQAKVEKLSGEIVSLNAIELAMLIGAIRKALNLPDMKQAYMQTNMAAVGMGNNQPQGYWFCLYRKFR